MVWMNIIGNEFNYKLNIEDYYNKNRDKCV